MSLAALRSHFSAPVLKRFILPAGSGASTLARAGSDLPPLAGKPSDHLCSMAELAFDAVRGEALAGCGEALGGADMKPLAVVHNRAHAACCLGAVEEPNQ